MTFLWYFQKVLEAYIFFFKSIERKKLGNCLLYYILRTYETKKSLNNPAIRPDIPAFLKQFTYGSFEIKNTTLKKIIWNVAEKYFKLKILLIQIILNQTSQNQVEVLNNSNGQSGLRYKLALDALTKKKL